jgi:type II secretory pathway pseudopilin PulG
MRRAFTLIELVAIVAIIGIIVTTAVVSVRSGQSAAKVKGATRDIFATIRHARSVALVSQQPSVITYSSEMVDGEVQAKIEIVTAEIFKESNVKEAWTLSGERVSLEGGEEDAGASDGDARSEESAAEGEGEVATETAGPGQSVGDVLFKPVSSEVLRGLRLKVTMGDEELEEERTAEQKKSMISAWGTASGIIESYRKQRADEKAKAAEEAALKEAATEDMQEPVSIVWEVNGRTEPHQVWIYRDGSTPEKGLSIKVDRFGGAKVLGLGEDD